MLVVFATTLAAQEDTVAVIGLVHSHVWGHLERMIGGQPARLVGIAETNPDLVGEARKMGAPDAVFASDYRQMLDAVKPTVVWAFVENNRHLEIVEACAPRKIHVIFEKPLASTLADALAITRLARKHGIQVMTNYQMAWWPSNYAAKAAADSGRLGKVWRLRGIVGHGGPGSTGARSQYFFAWLTDPVKNGGGALVDFGCYNALWSLWYLGRPEKVYAHVNHLRPETFPKVEDNSTMILSYRNGVGLFEGSWDLPRGFQDLEVFGLEASLDVTRDAVQLRSGREQARPLDLALLPPERAEPVAHMLQAIRGGQPLGDLVSLEMNVDVVEILEAAKKSVKTGAAVPLPAARPR
ncbi:MAG: Gfo/Idh/MocA family oxidoreductase [Bryobacteraceae bacterium]|nr:Gfo/Idh/MocA family oxidoreductase [Bryobacteraceae bacterium]